MQIHCCGCKENVHKDGNQKPDLEKCPFCGSTDVGGSALLGTLYISCYRCKAETQFKVTGLHVNEQMKRWNTRNA